MLNIFISLFSILHFCSWPFHSFWLVVCFLIAFWALVMYTGYEFFVNMFFCLMLMFPLNRVFHRAKVLSLMKFYLSIFFLLFTFMLLYLRTHHLIPNHEESCPTGKVPQVSVVSHVTKRKELINSMFPKG